MNDLEYNPATDKKIPATYDITNYAEGKAVCKSHFRNSYILMLIPELLYVP